MRRSEQERELTLLPNIAVLPLDVTQSEQVAQAVEAALARFGQIDVLVNNAGFGTNGPFEAATETQLLQQFDTNASRSPACTTAPSSRSKASPKG